MGLELNYGRRRQHPPLREIVGDAIQYEWTFAPLGAWIERTGHTERELRIIEWAFARYVAGQQYHHCSRPVCELTKS